MTRESKHPQIFSDIVVLFEIYYRIHEGMPKSFRVAVSEKILDRLSNAMHFIILANNVDKKTKIGREKGVSNILHLKAEIEIAWSFVLLGWKLKFVSNGAMAQLSEQFENIISQTLKWEKWFLNLSYN